MNRTVKVAIAVLGSLMLMVAGAVAYAAFPVTDGVVSAGVLTRGGSIRIHDAPTATSNQGEVPLNWNQQGVPGMSGYEEVRKTVQHDDISSEILDSALCPDGKVPIGGGANGRILDANGFFIS